MLVGRAAETATLEHALSRARAGQGSVLVLRGEGGVGKSSLLDVAEQMADGCQVARAAGVRSEMELPYAGLQQLFAGLAHDIDRLPGPQADAWRAAFGQTARSRSGHYLVCMAARALLAQIARAQTLVCLVDDVQWLDRASANALAFVARRLDSDPAALVFASRPVADSDPLAGLPELVVGALSTSDARTVLANALSSPVDPAVLDRILAEARGNPLALLELPRNADPDRLAGGFGVGFGASLEGRIESAFAARLGDLPLPTRMLLVVAAAEPVGDPAILWRAASLLSIAADAVEPAEDAGLIRIGARVTFRHPLVRSAVYDSATPTQLRRAHGALARATDPDRDPDRRAWHLAASTRGPSEAVAAELERSAGRAHARGGYFAAAAFLERAMELSADPSDRGRRALAAANLKELAGAPDAVTRLLAVAESGPLDPESRARATRLRGRGAFVTNRAEDAANALLHAARDLEIFDPDASRETYLEALSAALFATTRSGSTSPADVARAALAAPRPTAGARPSDLLLEGIATLVVEGSQSATPRLREALHTFADEDLPPETQVRWMWLASRMSVLLWDDTAWRSLAPRASRLARDAGALTALTAALSSEMALLVLTGDLDAADILADEAEGIAIGAGIQPLPYGPAVIGAWRGRSPDVDALLDSSLTSVTARGEGMGIALVHWARALLHNSRGQYEEALADAQRSISYPPAMLYSHWGLVEAIEAAARRGNWHQGEHALRRLAASTRASGSDWAMGVEARCTAALARDATAEQHFQEAIDHLERTAMTADLARAELLYGEWLRREKRRADARQHLRIASTLFTQMGMESFAQRTHLELLATGSTGTRIPQSRPPDLSAQELRVAQLASKGNTNQEIASQLFISVSTVDYHLRKVFRKLDINSRSKLHLVLPHGDSGSRPSGTR